jgi:hypothetical protein
MISPGMELKAPGVGFEPLVFSVLDGMNTGNSLSVGLFLSDKLFSIAYGA